MAGDSAPLFAADRPLRVRLHNLARAIVRGFERNDLLTYASAIAFQVLTAIIPFALFAFALLGVLHATGVWQHHLEPKLRAELSPAAFAVVREAVTNAFHGKRALWLTGGAALSVWQVSGAVRAVMGALSRVYESPQERPFLRRYVISFALTLEVSLCIGLVAACLMFAPFVSVAHPGLAWEVFAFVVRWSLVIAALFVVVALLVRHGPARRQALPWVSLGASLVIASWLASSALFELYLVDVASYTSVFGSLAAAIVAMAYLYLSAAVFLFGAQLDAIIRLHATGCAGGGDPGAPPESDPEASGADPADPSSTEPRADPVALRS